MVDIVGGIKNLEDCPNCKSEVLTLEELMYQQVDIISLFIDLGYREETVLRGLFKKRYREIKLIDCETEDGKFSFQESIDYVYNMMVSCNDK